MFVQSSISWIPSDLSNMRVTQGVVLPTRLADEAERLGAKLARLRVARGVKQHVAALRAGLSRNTAYRMEKGDPGVAVGQVLRYLEAISPGATLRDLVSERDPALKALSARERRQRASGMSDEDLKELDF